MSFGRGRRLRRASPWAENFIADIEVVVCEAAALAGEDAVVWILGGILRHADPEARPLFHTLEDEINAIGVPLCHSAWPGEHIVFLAHPLFGPLDRDIMIAGEGLDPVLVVGRSLAQDLFAEHRNAN